MALNGACQSPSKWKFSLKCISSRNVPKLFSPVNRNSSTEWLFAYHFQEFSLLVAMHKETRTTKIYFSPKKVECEPVKVTRYHSRMHARRFLCVSFLSLSVDILWENRFKFLIHCPLSLQWKWLQHWCPCCILFHHFSFHHEWFFRFAYFCMSFNLS